MFPGKCDVIGVEQRELGDQYLLVFASVAKQSRIFPRRDSGLLRYARNDGVERTVRIVGTAGAYDLR